MTNKNLSAQSGQVFILGLIVTGVVLVSVLIIIAGALLFSQNTKHSIDSLQAVNLAEAGIEKAIASLNLGGAGYNGEPETAFGVGSYSVAITTKNSTTKVIEARGYLPNKTNPRITRAVKVSVIKGMGASFNYGLQIGEGGLDMGSGVLLNGSVYSNGSVLSGDNTVVNGDAWVASGTQAASDQSSDCTGQNCSDFIFGKTYQGNTQFDVAQSFRPTQTAALNKVSLKLKIVGTVPDLTIRLVRDASGQPSKTDVLATGILPANSLSIDYNFVDVFFDQAPLLEDDTTYWLVIDTCGNSTTSCANSPNYWVWSVDSTQGYNRGASFWADNSQSGNPPWISISGDLNFKTFMGNVATSLDMTSSKSRVNGNVSANTISNVTIQKDAYYKQLTSAVVLGTKHPDSPDAPPITMPISDSNIQTWKAVATASQVSVGDVEGDNNCGITLGPQKIIGSLNLGNYCTVTIKSPLYITGNLTGGNTTKFKLDPSSGTSSGVIIVDGLINLNNGSNFSGSGTVGSYLVLLSDFDSRTNGTIAIDIGNSAADGIFYAPKGVVRLGNSTSLKEVSSWKLILGNNTILNYETGLASLVFSAGPSGSYTVVKGSYQQN